MSAESLQTSRALRDQQMTERDRSRQEHGPGWRVRRGGIEVRRVRGGRSPSTQGSIWRRSARAHEALTSTEMPFQVVAQLPNGDQKSIFNRDADDVLRIVTEFLTDGTLTTRWG